MYTPRVRDMSEEVYHEDVKTVSRDGVTVERELVCKEAGIEGTFEIESRRDGPVEVQVVDEFPRYFPIDDVAFRPSETPDDGDISQEQVSVTQTIVDDPVRVKYGIVPSEPVAEVRWSAPTIQRVEPGDAPDADDSPTDDADGSTGPIASLRGLFDGNTDAVDTPAADDDPSGDDGDPAAGEVVRDPSVEETEPTGSDAIESRVPSESGERELHADGHGTEDSTSAETAEEPSSGPAAESAEGHVDAVDEESAFDGPTEATGNGTGEAPAELTRGGRAGEAVSDTPEEDVDVARRFEVRLDRLTARVEKFGAYASALEPLIDERGTGTEVIEGIENDLADLDRRLNAVQSEIESVRDEREDELADVHENVDRIDEALDDVEAEVRTLEAAVDGLEGGLDDTEQNLDVLEDRVDGHDTALDEVETELDEVSSGVDEVASDVDEIERGVGEVERDVETVESEVEDVQNDIKSTQSDVETVEREVTAVENEVGAVEEDVETVHDDVEGVESDLRALEDRVDGFESELADLRESVEGVEAELSTVAETAQSVSRELDAIHDEVETLHEFRKSLAQISNVDS